MKLFVLSLIVSLSLNAYCANIKADDPEIYITKKCFRNSHNDAAYSELMNAVSDSPNCLASPVDRKLQYDIIDTNIIEYCQLFEQDCYYKYFENIGTKLAPCLDEDEAYFPNLVLSVYNATLAEFCGENGFKEIRAILRDVTTNPCIDHQFLDKLHTRCLENLILYENYEFNIFTIKKNDLCSDLQSVKGCIKEGLEEQCNKDYSNSLDYLFATILAPCA